MAVLINKTLSNCRVPGCDGSHVIEKINDGWIMTVEDFNNLSEHYRKNVASLCGELCKKDDVSCKLHQKIHKLSYFDDFVEDKTIDEEHASIFLIQIKEYKHSCCFGYYCCLFFC